MSISKNSTFGGWTRILIENRKYFWRWIFTDVMQSYLFFPHKLSFFFPNFFSVFSLFFLVYGSHLPGVFIGTCAHCLAVFLTHLLRTLWSINHDFYIFETDTHVSQARLKLTGEVARCSLISNPPASTFSVLRLEPRQAFF